MEPSIWGSDSCSVTDIFPAMFDFCIKPVRKSPPSRSEDHKHGDSNQVCYPWADESYEVDRVVIPLLPDVKVGLCDVCQDQTDGQEKLEIMTIQTISVARRYR